MFFFIGLAVVFGAVLGGYVLAGGKMAPIIKAAPFEFIIIAGAAIGGLIGVGAGIGIAGVGGKAVEAMARQPEMAGRVGTQGLIFAALVEGAALIAIVVAFLVVGKF